MNTIASLATAGWHDGPSWDGPPWPAFILVPLLLAAVIVLGVIAFRSRRPAGTAIVAERYARGDIDEAEYRRRLGELPRQADLGLDRNGSGRMTAVVRNRPIPTDHEGGGSAFRLGRGSRRAVLTLHIVAAGAWIGIDVVLGVLVLTAMLTRNADTEALCYRNLELFAVWPLLTVGIITLISGVALGLGTRYGLVRYWWVAVKLVMNVVLVSLVLLALRPAVSEAARYGEALAAGTPTDASVSQLIFPPIVSTTALVFATILAVYKPWGRLRKDRGRRGRVASGRAA